MTPPRTRRALDAATEVQGRFEREVAEGLARLRTLEHEDEDDGLIHFEDWDACPHGKRGYCHDCTVDKLT